MRRLSLLGLTLAGCLLPEVDLVDALGGRAASAGASGNGVGADASGGTSPTKGGAAHDAAGSSAVGVGADGGSAGASVLGSAGDGGSSAGYDGPITEIPTPTPNVTPLAICVGPDGNLWFTEETRGIARLTTDGVITEFPVNPEVRHAYWSITAGPDNELWFTDRYEGTVRHMTLAGLVTEASEPQVAPPFTWPNYITTGPDGNLWLTSEYTTDHKIYKLRPPYEYTSYPVPGTSFGDEGPMEIVTGPNDDLWFAGGTTGKIGRITISGEFTQYTLPPPSRPEKIAVGPDGNLWFTDEHDRVGKITTAGVTTLYPFPAQSSPQFIAAGPDEALWVTLPNSGQIARISTDGDITYYDVPTPKAGVHDIVAGPDGNIWFTERDSSKIGKLTL